MAETSHKRKHPPTFQHYPEKRARALKAQWIEKAKIKSKWKAQKRKEGLLTRPVHSVERGEPTQPEKTSFSESPEDSGSDDDNTAEAEQPQPSNPKRSDVKRSSPSKTATHINSNKRADSTADSTPSLRDLAREAYSPSTLHTYKSRLFQKGGRGRGSANGTRGRGQPNMKLRMGVMLEKIKREYS